MRSQPTKHFSSRELLDSQDCLERAKIAVHVGSEVRFFIPFSSLAQHFDINRINRILDVHAPGTAHHRLNAARIHARFRRLFCILLYLGRPADIEAFLSWETIFADAHLPLLHIARVPYAVRCVIDDFEVFLGVQRMFFPVTLTRYMDEFFDDDVVLPIVAREKIADGDGSTLHRVQIHGEYDNLAKISEQCAGGWRSSPAPVTYVIKTFDAGGRDLFEAEREAYLRMLEQGSDTKCVIGYHGCYKYHGKRAIILEHASQGSLSNFMQTNAPPSRREDVAHVCFSLLQLSKALDRMRSANLWHQDIAPTNVLLCEGISSPNATPLQKYTFVCKLADFGRSSVAVNDAAKDNRGTKIYGAPECYRDSEYHKSTKLLINPIADIFSLGALLLTVVVWLADGWTGVQDFERARRVEVEGLGMESIACFHNGHELLRSVQSRLDKAGISVNSLIKEICSKVCSELIRPMLHPDPAQRCTTAMVLRVATAIADSNLRPYMNSSGPSEQPVETRPRELEEIAGLQHQRILLEPEDEDEAPIPESLTTQSTSSGSNVYYLDGKRLEKYILARHIAYLTNPPTRHKAVIFDGRAGYQITGQVLSPETIQQLVDDSRRYRMRIV